LIGGNGKAGVFARNHINHALIIAGCQQSALHFFNAGIISQDNRALLAVRNNDVNARRSPCSSFLRSHKTGAVCPSVLTQ
jgi:hypothetical protein